MFALRRMSQKFVQQAARSMMPLEALACGSQQQSVTSGPAGSVYNVGKVKTSS